MEKIIEIANLTKTYGKNRGVTDVSFTVERGDIFGFLGPNGAGKSTTIRSMLGMIRPDSGSIRIFGKDSRREREEILKNIGYMPSEAVFYDSMTVREVIRFAADMRGMDCSKEAEKLCERLRMEPGKKKFPLREKRKAVRLSATGCRYLRVSARKQRSRSLSEERHRPEAERSGETGNA